MPKDEEKNRSESISADLNQFEREGRLGPLENRNEYEARLRELPPDQKRLAEASVRMADLCQYFSQQEMDLPAEVVERVAGLSGLTTQQRVRALIDINEGLMKYLHAIGKDFGVKQ
jgi:hypothetical protein